MVRTDGAFDVAMNISMPQFTPRKIASGTVRLFLFATIISADIGSCIAYFARIAIKMVPIIFPQKMTSKDEMEISCVTSFPALPVNKSSLRCRMESSPIENNAAPIAPPKER